MSKNKKMRRVLFLTFYFEPDLCAGSFRNTPFVGALAEHLSADDRIDVLTTFPNRYHEFRAKTTPLEEKGMVRIRRIPLPPHQSGMIDQAKAFLFYARGVLAAVHGEQYDLIFASSSRLMTAALGARIARKMKAPLYLDIRDIFVDTLEGILPGWKGRLILPFLKTIERGTIRTAHRVNLVSEGFLSYFKARYPEQRYSFFTNGIDNGFLGVEPPTANPSDGNRQNVLLYAGNIGEGQGLHHIVPQLAARLGNGWRLRIVGAGGALQRLKQAVERAGVTNVDMIAPVPRDQLLALYREAACLFLHLNAYDAFSKVLPSKIFEYAAAGKPILAGVAGFSAKFLEEEVENAAVFPPCDVETALAALDSLRLDFINREDFINRFRRDRIMDAMAKDVLRVVAAYEP